MPLPDRSPDAESACPDTKKYLLSVRPAPSASADDPQKGTRRQQDFQAPPSQEGGVKNAFTPIFN